MFYEAERPTSFSWFNDCFVCTRLQVVKQLWEEKPWRTREAGQSPNIIQTLASVSPSAQASKRRKLSCTEPDVGGELQ